MHLHGGEWFYSAAVPRSTGVRCWRRRCPGCGVRALVTAPPLCEIQYSNQNPRGNGRRGPGIRAVSVRNEWGGEAVVVRRGGARSKTFQACSHGNSLDMQPRTWTGCASRTKVSRVGATSPMSSSLTVDSRGPHTKEERERETTWARVTLRASYLTDSTSTHPASAIAKNPSREKREIFIPSFYAPEESVTTVTFGHHKSWHSWDYFDLANHSSFK